jgi:hypothetical protein
MLRICCSLLIFAGMVTAAPPSTSQTGQLIDASSERVFTGTADGVFGPQARYISARSYVIRAGDREYVIALRRPAKLSLRPPAPHGSSEHPNPIPN